MLEDLLAWCGNTYVRSGKYAGRKKKIGRPPKYPWDDWLDGTDKVVPLSYFGHLTPSGIGSILYGTAKRRGMRLVMHYNTLDKQLEFRAYRREQ